MQALLSGYLFSLLDRNKHLVTKDKVTYKQLCLIWRYLLKSSCFFKGSWLVSDVETTLGDW